MSPFSSPKSPWDLQAGSMNASKASFRAPCLSHRVTPFRSNSITPVRDPDLYSTTTGRNTNGQGWPREPPCFMVAKTSFSLYTPNGVPIWTPKIEKGDQKKNHTFPLSLLWSTEHLPTNSAHPRSVPCWVRDQQPPLQCRARVQKEQQDVSGRGNWSYWVNSAKSHKMLKFLGHSTAKDFEIANPAIPGSRLSCGPYILNMFKILFFKINTLAL